jgi:glycosyltransferase involved in cell wall biosynthesis
MLVNKSPEISIVLPCRNEEETLDYCLLEIERVIKKNNLNSEIIVSDSSTDKSPEIAKKHGVIIIKHDKEGYGNAYLEGFKIAKGKYIFMADSDGTYNFEDIPKFIYYLKNDYDLVIGNRFSGKMDKHAMSWSHKHIGNPILSGILRLFFKTNIKDAHSGIRAIKKESLDKLSLSTTGMEFASEMIIKSVKNDLKIKEIPTDYYKRKGKSKLKSIPDGWRHLRFMLLYCPLFLFLIPGIVLLFLGLISGAWVYFGDPILFGISLFIIHYSYHLFLL